MMKKIALLGLLVFGVLLSYAQDSAVKTKCDSVSLDIEQSRKSTTVKGTVTTAIDNENVEKAVAVVYLRYKNCAFSQYQQADLTFVDGEWSGQFESLLKQKGLESAQIIVYTYTTDGSAQRCLIPDGIDGQSEMALVSLR